MPIKYINHYIMHTDMCVICLCIHVYACMCVLRVWVELMHVEPRGQCCMHVFLVSSLHCIWRQWRILNLESLWIWSTELSPDIIIYRFTSQSDNSKAEGKEIKHFTVFTKKKWQTPSFITKSHSFLCACKTRALPSLPVHCTKIHCL